MVGSESPQPAPAPPTLPTPPPEVPPADLPKPEDTSGGNLATKIRLYFDTFPAKLKDIKPKKSLDKLSEEQLKDLEKSINYTLGAKTNVEAMSKAVPLMIKAIEDLAAKFTPLRIGGTHAVCYEPDVMDNIKFCIIDSGYAGINSTPQQRLMFTLATTAMKQHVINSALEGMTAEQKQALARATGAMNQPQPQDDSKYDDL